MLHTHDFPAQPRACQRPAHGRESILVIEDDDAVRTVIGRVLRRHHYHVLEARDGRHATEVATAYQAAIHLLVVDVVLPRLSGPAAVDEILAHRPETRVLYLSGYAEEAIERHGGEARYSRDKFKALRDRDKKAVLKFLETI